MAEIISRAAAKAAGLKVYFTGRACPQKHIAARRVSTGGCVECNKDSCRRWKTSNAIQHAAINREWRLRNLEVVQGRERARAAAERAEDPDKARARWRTFADRHPERIYANTARQRARRLQRTPLWADHSKIVEVYKLATFATELTGVPHHVDHEIPIQSKFVSGLHVHTNLRVIPGVENLRKHNRFVPYAEHYATADEIAEAMIPC